MSSVDIHLVTNSHKDTWDSYVQNHPHGTLYHLFGWKNVIERTYGHKTYYLMASNSGVLGATDNRQLATGTARSAVGILPLVHLKHFLFGNSLVSMPFFDTGGILANNEETEKTLLLEAVKLGQDLKVSTIELRHTEPLAWLIGSPQPIADSRKPNEMSASFPQKHFEIFQFHLETEKIKESNQSCSSCLKIQTATSSHKVRMLLELPDSSDALMRSFKSKLRSQIRKPIKEGLNAMMGGADLLNDFYHVFCLNMRDLGSPVHSKKLIQNVLAEFPEKAKIVIVYKEKEPVACSVVIGFKEILENPWASALRNYSRLSPNMLLYWTMLEYACDNGYSYFDFGRSTPDEGTYKFKEQWGSKPTPLHWHYVSLDGGQIETAGSEKSKFDKAIHYWQKLPVPVTKVLGPMIRKHIPL